MAAFGVPVVDDCGFERRAVVHHPHGGGNQPVIPEQFRAAVSAQFAADFPGMDILDVALEDFIAAPCHIPIVNGAGFTLGSIPVVLKPDRQRYRRTSRSWRRRGLGSLILVSHVVIW